MFILMSEDFDQGFLLDMFVAPDKDSLLKVVDKFYNDYIETYHKDEPEFRRAEQKFILDALRKWKFPTGSYIFAEDMNNRIVWILVSQPADTFSLRMFEIQKYGKYGAD